MGKIIRRCGIGLIALAVGLLAWQFYDTWLAFDAVRYTPKGAPPPPVVAETYVRTSYRAPAIKIAALAGPGLWVAGFVIERIGRKRRPSDGRR